MASMGVAVENIRRVVGTSLPELDAHEVSTFVAEHPHLDLDGLRDAVSELRLARATEFPGFDLLAELSSTCPHLDEATIAAESGRLRQLAIECALVECMGPIEQWASDLLDDSSGEAFTSEFVAVLVARCDERQPGWRSAVARVWADMRWSAMGELYADDEGHVSNERLKAMADAFDSLGAKADSARTRFLLGQRHLGAQALTDAEADLRLSREQYQDIGDEFGLAASLQNLGVVHDAMQEYQQAQDELLRASELFDRLAASQNAADALFTLGSAYRPTEHYAAAIEAYRDAKTRYVELELTEQAAMCELNTARTLQSWNRREDAIAAFQSACEMFQGIGRLDRAAECDMNAGDLIAESFRGPVSWARYQQAERAYLRARSWWDVLANDDQLAECDLRLGELHNTLGRFALAVKHFHATLERASSIGRHDLVAASHYDLGNTYQRGRRWPESARHFEQAKGVYAELDRPDDVADTAARLGHVQEQNNDLESARSAFEEAARRYRDMEQPRRQADMLLRIAKIDQQAGRYESAEQANRFAYDRFVALGALVRAGESVLQLGSLYAETGRFVDAERELRLAQGLFAKADSRSLLAESTRELGRLYTANGRQKDAAETFAVASDMFDVLGQFDEAAMCLLRLGEVHWAAGQLEQAASAYAGAYDAAFRVLNATREQWTAAYNAGVAHRELGRHSAALTYFLTARDISARRGDETAAANLDVELARIAGAMGDIESAEHQWAAAEARFRTLDMWDRVAQCLNRRGALCLDSGRTGESENLHLQALEVAKDVGDPDLLASTHHHLGCVYFSQDRDSDATDAFIWAKDLYAINGADEVDIAACDHGLAVVYFRTNRYDEAERIFTDCCDTYRRRGMDRQLAAALGGLARIRSNTHRFRESIPLLREARELFAKLGETTMAARSDVMIAIDGWADANTVDGWSEDDGPFGALGLREAIDLALPALLHIDAQRFTLSSAATRFAWQSIELWIVRFVFDWCARLGDQRLLAELVEWTVNSGSYTSMADDRLESDDHGIKYLTFTPDGPATFRPPRGVETPLGGPLLPMTAPPRLLMPWGHVALEEHLDRADVRYGRIERTVTVRLS